VLRNLIISFLFFILLLLFPQKTFAAIIPNLLSPSNNSTVTDTSPKLSWSYSGQCTGSGSCFRIQVASSSAFTSAYRDYYTNYTYYSPQLYLRQWFWRAKAKDSSNAWSDWSTIFSFNIVSTPSPTPTPSQSPSTPTQSPTLTPIDSASTTSTSFDSSSDSILSDSTSNSTMEPKATSLSVKLFDLKATSSSKSVLPASTKSSSPLSSPKSKEEKFLAEKEINLSKILIVLGVIIIISGGGIALKSFKK